MRYATEQRRALAAFLERHVDKTFSAQDIARASVAKSISLSAIYRNLAALEADGQLRRIAVPGHTEIRYQFASTGHCGETLHLSCRRCGKTFHAPAEASRRFSRMVTRANGFEIDLTGSVMYGMCTACRRA